MIDTLGVDDFSGLLFKMRDDVERKDLLCLELATTI